jgi:hypothetical protein
VHERSKNVKWFVDILDLIQQPKVDVVTRVNKLRENLHAQLELVHLYWGTSLLSCPFSATADV